MDQRIAGHFGQFVVAVVPANVGLETASTAIAVVEFLDNEATRGGRRHEAVRDVLAVRTEPVDRSTSEVVDAVVALAAPRGHDVRVVVNLAGSPSAAITWQDAYRKGELARAPRLVTIGGDGLGVDDRGWYRVGEAELIGSLREMVKTKAFSLPPQGDGADVLSAAMTIEPSVTEAGRLKFPSRKRDGRVFALALALYPQWTPSHAGRRYRD